MQNNMQSFIKTQITTIFRMGGKLVTNIFNNQSRTSVKNQGNFRKQNKLMLYPRDKFRNN